MTYQTRRITIGVLGVLTLLLAGFSMFLAFNTNTQPTNIPNTSVGNFALGRECTPGRNECNEGANQFCTLSSDGKYRCNQADEANRVCPNNGTCDAYIAFKCDKLTNGQCFGNRQGGFETFESASNYAGGCGQVDTVCSTDNNILCGDFRVFNSSCQSDTPPPPAPKSFVCQNFKCVQVDGTSGTPTIEACQANCKPPTPVACGQACSATKPCAAGNTCTDGVCVLNGCTASNCTNGCTPLCGGPCVGAGQGNCPVNQTCGANGVCLLTSCVGNAGCTNNGCTVPAPLPDTAFGDGGFPVLMFGILLCLVSLMVFRLNLVGLALSNFAFYRAYIASDFYKHKKSINRLSKSRKGFEDRF
jgi:hypothetical protein